MKLPIEALWLLFRSPSLLLMSIFPGLFTMLVSSTAVYFLWKFSLLTLSLWISIPIALISFLLFWVVFGNLSLIPVEDAIIDKVQIAKLGSVKVPTPRFSMKRIVMEFLFSLLVMGAAVLFLFLSLIPGAVIVSFILGAWLTAYGFLATYYARSTQSPRERLRIFFYRPFAHFLLGAFLNILLFLPLVNVFLLGYALILATLFGLRAQNLK